MRRQIAARQQNTRRFHRGKDHAAGRSREVEDERPDGAAEPTQCKHSAFERFVAAMKTADVHFNAGAIVETDIVRVELWAVIVTSALQYLARRCGLGGGLVAIPEGHEKQIKAHKRLEPLGET